ncbi:MAG: lipocalin-like domain-containing protein [Archangium sp.]
MISLLLMAGTGAAPTNKSLEGTWTLVAADVTHADGSRGRDYGESPKGLLVIDAAGRYSLQIYKSERPKFAAGEKAKGTPVEFQSAVMGMSAHFGRIEVGAQDNTLTFKIETASFPNWEGTDKVCPGFEFKGEEFSYQSPKRPNGDTPISIWRRAK